MADSLAVPSIETSAVVFEVACLGDRVTASVVDEIKVSAVTSLVASEIILVMVVTVLFVVICVLDSSDDVIEVVDVRGITEVASAITFDVSAIVILANAFVVIRASTYSDAATGDVVGKFGIGVSTYSKESTNDVADKFIGIVIGAVIFEDDIVVDFITVEVVFLVVTSIVAAVVGAVKFEDEIFIDTFSVEIVFLVVPSVVIVDDVCAIVTVEAPTVVTIVGNEIVSDSVSVDEVNLKY